MLTTVFATKLGMTQAWTKAGKRVPITRCLVVNNVVVGMQPAPASKPELSILEIGSGKKKAKQMTKPLRSRLEKAGVSHGVLSMHGVRVAMAEGETLPSIGQAITTESILAVGDVVRVQGVSKGKGFAGAVKRHGFAGGPRTHGQSDRERAVGAIGNRTTPGRVFKGKRMPGHMGVDTLTVRGLVIVHIDPETSEIWLSGPVPGAITSEIRIEKTGETKQMELVGVKQAEVKAEEVSPTEEAAV